ncbi:MAG: ATP-dependent sacrificial sulfur transferase LarE [Armatimonadota bacterium]
MISGKTEHNLSLECEDKLHKLRDLLRDTGGCAVAYSGGVDSSLLLAVASEVLGDRCLAVIATSSTYPQREFDAAISWVVDHNIAHVVVVSEELDIPEFTNNPPNRCYFCKRELFRKVREQADLYELPHIAHGANADDINDFRPGIHAGVELGALSPLKEAGLTKNDIRLIARDVYNLSVADKPAMACLSSRFPYGSSITREKLRQVEAVENYLFDHGFRVLRARHHGEVLRLELGPEEMLLMQDSDTRAACVDYAKKHGFAYVTLDLEGFRSGSMNEVLAVRKV